MELFSDIHIPVPSFVVFILKYFQIYLNLSGKSDKNQLVLYLVTEIEKVSEWVAKRFKSLVLPTKETSRFAYG